MLRSFKSAFSAAHRKAPFPMYRRLITDLLREGRRQNTIYEYFEADITDFMAWRAQTKAAGGKTVSVTAYVSSCLADCIGAEPEMQAYRTGFGRKLIVFDDVDMAFSAEKTVAGETVLWAFIIRACNRKTADEVEQGLDRIKTTPIEETASWRLASKLAPLPAFLRRLTWLGPRYSPFLQKKYLGTVAVTSPGMFSKGRLIAVPISPMTLTLSIGSIDPQPVFQDGVLAEREIITLMLSADHDVVDGAPLARLIAKFRDKIADPETALAP